MTTRIAKGSVWALAGTVAPLAVALFTTPFVIRLLGPEGYGVFVLVGLIPTYAQFADLGMMMASTRFGSEAYGEGLAAKEAAITRTAAMVALISALPFALLFIVLSASIVTYFDVPEALRFEAALALRFAAVTFVLNFLNSIFNTPQLARLRMDLNAFIVAGTRIAGLVAVPITLYSGGGIAAALFALMLSSVLTLITHLVVSSKLLPELIGVTIDPASIRPLLRFGGPLALSGIAAVLLSNVEKLVLTSATSVETLAYYSVAFTFSSMGTLFSLAMNQALIPAYSQLLAPERRQQLNGLFSRAIRLNVLGLAPLLVILCVIGRPFLTLWAGDAYGRESSLPLYVLLIGLFFNLNAYVPAALIVALGRTDIVAKLYWIQLLPYLAVTWLLTVRFGAVGAASAWSLRVMLEAFVYMHLARRAGDVSLNIGRHLPALLLAMAILAIAAAAAIVSTGSFILPAVALVICLAAYSALLWTKLIDDGEKVWVNRMFARLLRRAA